MQVAAFFEDVDPDDVMEHFKRANPREYYKVRIKAEFALVTGILESAWRNFVRDIHDAINWTLGGRS